MGTSVRSAMLESIKQGDSLAKTLRTGLGAAVSNVQAKFKGMGAATKSVATDIGNAFKHPIQTIKATLGKALNGAEEDARGLGTQADDTGRRLDDMGKKGAGAGENLVGVLKRWRQLRGPCHHQERRRSDQRVLQHSHRRCGQCGGNKLQV